jgi:hypothetical protein
LTASLATALLPGLVLAACAGPGGAASGDRVLVRLYDAENDTCLELANASHPDLRDVYSQRRPDADLKLAPDDLMGQLLQSLDSVRFGALSTPGAPPPEELTAAEGLRGWVEVAHNGEVRTFRVPALRPSADQLQAFTRMKLVISEYYSHVGGLQFIDNPQGHRVFGQHP